VQAFVNQRRSVLLALAMCVGALWISVPLGKWQVGVFVACGVLLSMLNNVLTEQTLLNSVESGDLPTRKQYASQSLVRLMAISLVAVVLAVVFWPDGATVFIGLALFHLIALVFTGIPLLKEIKKV
jgi:uncharacterized membrane protein